MGISPGTNAGKSHRERIKQFWLEALRDTGVDLICPQDTVGNQFVEVDQAESVRSAMTQQPLAVYLIRVFPGEAIFAVGYESVAESRYATNSLQKCRIFFEIAKGCA
jgi:hypothetical protein